MADRQSGQRRMVAMTRRGTPHFTAALARRIVGTLVGGPHQPVRTTDDPTALLGHGHPRHHPNCQSTI
jgi:hypothetical protein